MKIEDIDFGEVESEVSNFSSVKPIIDPNSTRPNIDPDPEKKKKPITKIDPTRIKVKIGAGLGIENNNPGNLRFAGQKGAVKGSNNNPDEAPFAKFETPEEGFMALIRDIDIKKSGKSVTGITADSTISDFVSVYAPSNENNVGNYVQFLDKDLDTDDLDITPDTRIGDIDSFALAKSIAMLESRTEVTMLDDENRRIATADTSPIEDKRGNILTEEGDEVEEKVKLSIDDIDWGDDVEDDVEEVEPLPEGDEGDTSAWNMLKKGTKDNLMPMIVGGAEVFNETALMIEGFMADQMGVTIDELRESGLGSKGGFKESAKAFTKFQTGIDVNPYNIEGGGYIDEWSDFQDPTKIKATVLENAPHMIASMAMFTSSKYLKIGSWAARGTLGAMYAGNAYNEISNIEEATGVKMSREEKLMRSYVAGGINTAMEMASLNRIFRVGGMKSLGGKLAGIGVATFTESLQEAGQEFTDYMSAYGFREHDSEEMFQRMKIGAFAGGLMGAAGGVGSAVTGSLASDQSNKYVKPEFVKDEENNVMNPMFRVNKADHPLTGKLVDIQTIKDDPELQVPKYHAEKLRAELKDGGMTGTQIDGVMGLFNIAANSNDKDLDTFIGELGIEYRNGDFEQSIPNIDESITDALYNLDEDVLRRHTVLWNTIGERAQLSSSEALLLQRAIQLEKEGATEEELKIKTGWFRRKHRTPEDNKWRKRVDNRDFGVDPEKVKNIVKGKPVKLKDILSDDSLLFKYYPEVRDIEVTWRSLPKDRGGQFRPNLFGSGDIDMSSKIKPGSDNFNSILVHEIQHLIQAREQFGFTENAKKALSSKHPLMKIKFSLDKLKGAKTLKELQDTLNEIIKPFAVNEKSLIGGKRRQVRSEIRRNLESGLSSSTAFLIYDIQNATSFKEARRLANRLKGHIQDDIDDAEFNNYQSALHEEEARQAQALYDQMKRIKDTVANPSAIKGEISMKDNENVITVFQKGDYKTLIHEVAHLFRRNMPEAIQQGMKEHFTKDGKWDRKSEEAFADFFMEWVKSDFSERSKNTAKHKFINNIMEDLSLTLIDTQVKARKYQQKGRLTDKPIKDATNRLNNAKVKLSELKAELAELNQKLYNATKKADRDEIEKQINTTTDAINKAEENVITSEHVLKEVTEEYSTFNKLAPIMDGIFDKFENIASVDDSKKAKFWYRLFKIFDIDSSGAAIGMPETFKAIRGYFSTKSAHNKEGAHLVTQLRKTLGRKGFKKNLMEAFLIAESKSEMKALLKSDNKKMINAVRMIRDYFDASEIEYLEAGGLRQGFKDRILADLTERMEKAQTESDRDTLQDLIADIEQASNLEFVHIPTAYWLIAKGKANAADAKKIWNEIYSSKSLKIQEGDKRRTFSLRDLFDDPEVSLEQKDVDPTDIIKSYAERKGNDLALLHIRRSAKAEGGVRKTGRLGRPERSDGFHPADFRTSAFAGYEIHGSIKHWLDSITKETSMFSMFRNALNTVKMGMFYNPIFLPMYDVTQGLLHGSFSPSHPVRSLALIGRGLHQALTNGADYREAARHRTFAQPFDTPFNELDFMYNNADKGYTFAFLRSLFPKGENKLKTLASIPVRAIMGAYKLSFDLAWTLDQGIRTSTYIYNRDTIGMSKAEAGDRAALVHGDYSRVPVNTRRTMNTIFFTPTFKFAMGNFLIQGLKNMPGTVTSQTTVSNKQLGGVVLRSLGMMMAFDMMLIALGWEREKFSMKYAKDVVTDIGPKQLVINLSAPHNMFLKYYYRWEDANEAGGWNSVQDWLALNKWEVHPLYRIASSWFQNDKGGGNPIYYQTDPPTLKAAKTAEYLTTETFQMLKQITGEGTLDRTGQEVFTEEYGEWQNAITSLVTFKYTRDPQMIRFQKRLQQMQRVAQEELFGGRYTDMIMRNATEEDINEYLENLDSRRDEYIEEIGLLIDEIEAYTYDNPYDDLLRDLGDIAMPEKKKMSIDDIDFG